MYEIDSLFEIGQQLPEFDQETVKNELMFFNGNFDFCYSNGGPITKSFLEAIILNEKKIPPNQLVIDTRVHMLMPGWFPCIPGFHHDDVPRSRSDGQPNYDNPEYRSKHVVALINGDIAPTEFALGKFRMPEIPLGGTIYKVWHKEVERHLEIYLSNNRVNAPSNRLIYFDDRTFHQGTRAVAGGWRWFGRASWCTDRKPTNEIRRQVQVYLEFPMEGW